MSIFLFKELAEAYDTWTPQQQAAARWNRKYAPVGFYSHLIKLHLKYWSGELWRQITRPYFYLRLQWCVARLAFDMSREYFVEYRKLIFSLAADLDPYGAAVLAAQNVCAEIKKR